MIESRYKNQVELLLDVLPSVAAEKCFAMHGGTAINLFVRDMPRLSVDIDLTYLPIEDRPTTLSNITAALRGVQDRLRTRQPDMRVTLNEQMAKLLCSRRGARKSRSR